MAKAYAQTIPEEVLIQVRILELMFDDPGLTDLRKGVPDHPAVQRVDQLSGFANAEQFDWDRGHELAEAVGSMLIDRSSWVGSFDQDDFWSLIEESKARKSCIGRIRDPHQFGDVLAELFYFGWLASEGLTVQLSGAEGLPDLTIVADSGPVRAEVKRIRQGSGPERARAVIKKANQQIKRANPDSAGVVYLSVDRLARSTGTDDVPPEDVQPYLDQVSRQLSSGLTRSVAVVCVSWDDWIELPSKRTSLAEFSTFVIRRRTLVAEHPEPREDVSLPDRALNIGTTAMIVLKRAL